tara:strand:+ start:3692 stop:3883 length:192 start_codon:yes stop_codon:yes gene_type:complete
MKMQTLSELEHAIGGRPKRILRKKKIRLSFYLDLREAEQLKVFANEHDKTISKIVRELLKTIV